MHKMIPLGKLPYNCKWEILKEGNLNVDKLIALSNISLFF